MLSSSPPWSLNQICRNLVVATNEHCMPETLTASSARKLPRFILMVPLVDVCTGGSPRWMLRHVDLCLDQSFFWQSLEQYRMLRQPAQFIRRCSSRSSLTWQRAQERLETESGLAEEDAILLRGNLRRRWA